MGSENPETRVRGGFVVAGIAALSLGGFSPAFADMDLAREAYSNHDYDAAEAAALPEVRAGDPEAEYLVAQVIYDRVFLRWNLEDDELPWTDAERERYLTLLTSAANKGLAPAQRDYASWLERQAEAPTEESIRWYKTASDGGDVIATRRVLQLYCDERRDLISEDGLISRLDAAAHLPIEEGALVVAITGAARDLGYQFAMGTCFPRSRERAEEYYLLSIQSGDEAIRQLLSYDIEAVVSRLLGSTAFQSDWLEHLRASGPPSLAEKREALEWIEFMADYDLANTHATLGEVYARGEIVAQSPTSALHHFARYHEAMLGTDWGSNAGALIWLLAMDLRQSGDPEDFGTAVRLLEYSASLGDISSMLTLADEFHRGDRLPRSTSTAADYYRAAAVRGSDYGQYYLSVLLASGDGVLEDPTAAYAWASLAAASGSEVEFVQWRNDLGRSLSADEREAGAQLARSWLIGSDLSFSSRQASGSPSDLVFSVQRGLAALGYDVGEPDGIDGPRTQAAIDAFGADYGVDVANASLADLAIAIGAVIGMEMSRSDDGYGEKPESSIIKTGSGFLISPDGQVITNAHVVEGCTAVRVGGGALATSIIVDSSSDLALISVNGDFAASATLRQGRGVRLGDEVVIIGYPLSGMLSSGPSVTSGEVSALAGPGDDRRLIQISAPVQPGNSGGPVLDRSGNLVGVVVAKLDASTTYNAAGDLPENVNFAISLGTLQSFLDNNSVSYAVAETLEDLSTADIAEGGTRYTVPLACEN